MGKLKPTEVVLVERVTQSIRVFRGLKVVLDAELAELYGVPTKRLNEQVRELARRFDQLEARVEKLVAHDQALGVILSAIRALMSPPPPPPKGRSIGFTAGLRKTS
ncbi:MAG TPA: ORF6N domain-containing protein [Steroidobacteraceae bacterium]|nr:ORF6N domain-containing protein [Steroidobacteraceae bacterium]